MANFEFFQNSEDLERWIKSRPTGEEAASELMSVVNLMDKDYLSDIDRQEIASKCEEIYVQDDSSADVNADILMGVLSHFGLAKITKIASTFERFAESRQRNGWERGQRNKWNRITCSEIHEGTEWRKDRDAFYNFTHYTTDALKFDEDPNHVYSGEALWRMYIMDKFTREYKDANGKWVGGYINNRFHVFPEAGTPANPKVSRDGGNQMELSNTERTRKPRPHQYSIERRLEEARGNKTYDIVASSFSNIVKVASTLPKERNEDRIYNMFRDVIDMTEAGFSYTDVLEKVANHYEASIEGVAQLALKASKMIEKHEGIGYRLAQSSGTPTFQMPSGDVVVLIDPSTKTYQYVDGANTGETFVMQTDQEASLMPVENQEGDLQMVSEEVGLLD